MHPLDPNSLFGNPLAKNRLPTVVCDEAQSLLTASKLMYHRIEKTKEIILWHADSKKLLTGDTKLGIFSQALVAELNEVRKTYSELTPYFRAIDSFLPLHFSNASNDGLNSDDQALIDDYMRAARVEGFSAALNKPDSIATGWIQATTKHFLQHAQHTLIFSSRFEEVRVRAAMMLSTVCTQIQSEVVQHYFAQTNQGGFKASILYNVACRMLSGVASDVLQESGWLRGKENECLRAIIECNSFKIPLYKIPPNKEYDLLRQIGAACNRTGIPLGPLLKAQISEYFAERLTEKLLPICRPEGRWLPEHGTLPETLFIMPPCSMAVLKRTPDGEPILFQSLPTSECSSIGTSLPNLYPFDYHLHSADSGTVIFPNFIHVNFDLYDRVYFNEESRDSIAPHSESFVKGSETWKAAALTMQESLISIWAQYGALFNDTLSVAAQALFIEDKGFLFLLAPCAMSSKISESLSGLCGDENLAEQVLSSFGGKNVNGWIAFTLREPAPVAVTQAPPVTAEVNLQTVLGDLLRHEGAVSFDWLAKKLEPFEVRFDATLGVGSHGSLLRKVGVTELRTNSWDKITNSTESLYSSYVFQALKSLKIPLQNFITSVTLSSKKRFIRRRLLAEAASD